VKHLLLGKLDGANIYPVSGGRH